MIWLMMHQWILLIAAFLLGLLIGWWLWSRSDTGQRRQEQAPPAQARAPIKSGAAFAEITSPAVAQALAADTGAGDMPPLYDAPSAGPADDEAVRIRFDDDGPHRIAFPADADRRGISTIANWSPSPSVFARMASLILGGLGMVVGSLLTRKRYPPRALDFSGME